MKSGIVIGSGRLVTLSDRQLRDVLHWIKEAYPDVTAEECTNIAKRFSRILINNDIEMGTVYRISDTIAIRDALSPHTEWVMELKDMFVYGSVRNSYFTFVDGEFYAPQTIRGRIALQHDTKQPKLIKWTYVNLCVQKSNLINRKIMLYPDPHNRSNPAFYLSIDIDNYIEPKSIVIPPCPPDSAPPE